jgi:hypothetical protein
MPSRTWVIRSLLVLALAAPLGLLIFAPTPSSRPTPQRVTDLRRVYELLPERCLYNDFNEWCGLRVMDTTAEEAAFLRNAVESAPDPKQVWCSPLTEHLRTAPSRTKRFPEGIKWYRLSHPTDRSQWIGIGVKEAYNTGWTAYWIMCRIPVGFAVDS